MSAPRVDPSAVLARLQGPVNAYLMRQAHAEMWAERVRAWELKELARFEYFGDPEMTARRGISERITDPARVYMLAEPWRSWWYEERQVFVDSLGLGLEPGICPALVAEGEKDKAARALVADAEGLPGLDGLTWERMIRTPGAMDRGVSLLVRLCVLCPGYQKPRGGYADLTPPLPAAV